MGKASGWAFVTLGVVLLVIGFQAYHSVGSGLSKVFTGAPTNRAIFLLAGGAVCAAFGLAQLSRRP